MNTIAILNFYHFYKINNCESIFQKLLLIGKKQSIKGTILISNEGLNCSISGHIKELYFFYKELCKIALIDKKLNYNLTYSNNNPFQRFVVKIKQEIVTMKVQALDLSNKGEYIDSRFWDDFIRQDDVITIDVRNKYETDSGKFINAITPNINSFKELPEWLNNNFHLFFNKKIAMYCTGGIRCEKSTAYMIQLGFNNTYQLKGGIIQYLKHFQNAHCSSWDGNCFVFDSREHITKNLSPYRK